PPPSSLVGRPPAPAGRAARTGRPGSAGRDGRPVGGVTRLRLSSMLHAMTVIPALQAIVGDRNVVSDRDVVATYERDWTGRFGAPPACGVRPADAGEVAAVLRACAEAGVPVVPQGGNTGLVGGGVPRAGGEVVLSLARMDGIGAVDPALGVVEVGAGVTLGAL